jgi:hypothetical protein
VSPAITMTGAITALVTEKRATGCKYDAEERVLARFAAFCRSRFLLATTLFAHDLAALRVHSSAWLGGDG